MTGKRSSVLCDPLSDARWGAHFIIRVINVDPESSESVQYGFHHTCADYLMALIGAGFEILLVEEDPVPDLPEFDDRKAIRLPWNWQVISRKK